MCAPVEVAHVRPRAGAHARLPAGHMWPAYLRGEELGSLLLGPIAVVYTDRVRIAPIVPFVNTIAIGLRVSGLRHPAQPMQGQALHYP